MQSLMLSGKEIHLPSLLKKRRKTKQKIKNQLLIGAEGKGLKRRVKFELGTRD